MFLDFVCSSNTEQQKKCFSTLSKLLFWNTILGNPIALPQVGEPPQTSAQRFVSTTATPATTRRQPTTQSPPVRTTTSSSRRPISQQFQPDDDDLSAEEIVNFIKLFLECFNLNLCSPSFS